MNQRPTHCQCCRVEFTLGVVMSLAYDCDRRRHEHRENVFRKVLQRTARPVLEPTHYVCGSCHDWLGRPDDEGHDRHRCPVGLSEATRTMLALRSLA